MRVIFRSDNIAEENCSVFLNFLEEVKTAKLEWSREKIFCMFLYIKISIIFCRRIYLRVQSIPGKREIFSSHLSLQVQYINKETEKVQPLTKWFIDILGLLKLVTVNVINFWIKSVHCKVKADRMALKLHLRQSKSINECSASEEDPHC